MQLHMSVQKVRIILAVMREKYAQQYKAERLEVVREAYVDACR